MEMKIHATAREMAEAAAVEGAAALQGAIAEHGSARLIAATGAAQFHFLTTLTAMPGIDWKKVELFHLDEYIGMANDHRASFVRFLRERLVSKTGIEKTHFLDGTANPADTIERITAELRKRPVDVAFIGIGENAHLAFNDPPAQFETTESFLVVELDQACRQQQFGEGWFPTFADVPQTALTMTVPEMLRARKIIAIVPEARKAAAVAACFEGDVTPMAPASILRNHAATSLYLDRESASLLTAPTIAKYTA